MPHNTILEEYIQWTDSHDKNYCYDELHNFIDEKSKQEDYINKCSSLFQKAIDAEYEKMTRN